MRSGTENVPGIAGIGEAARAAYENFDEKVDKLISLKDRLIDILNEMEDIVDDHMIDTMAVVSDLVIEDGPITQRFLELKRCIRTRIQYESKRFPRHIS